MKLLLNPEYKLYEKSGKPFCDSLQVAETFEKKHAHVLRDIESAIDTFMKINQSKFGEINFIKSIYKDTKNRSQPKYLLSKDGFSYLTMGFEGEKAAQFKIAYINRFNQMETFIQSLQQAKTDYPAFTEAVMLAHDEPKHYHFSNEINMIYRIVLGMDAKEYRKRNNIPTGTDIRANFTLEQLKAVETLQRIDVGLFEIGLKYDERKEKLIQGYQRRLDNSNRKTLTLATN